MSAVVVAAYTEIDVRLVRGAVEIDKQPHR